jgi:hypothetical protein
MGRRDRTGLADAQVRDELPAGDPLGPIKRHHRQDALVYEVETTDQPRPQQPHLGGRQDRETPMHRPAQQAGRMDRPSCPRRLSLLTFCVSD